jgi:hypothetical protein
MSMVEYKRDWVKIQFKDLTTRWPWLLEKGLKTVPMVVYSCKDYWRIKLEVITEVACNLNLHCPILDN